MRFLVLIALLFIGYVSYQSLMDDSAVEPLDDEDLQEVLKKESSENKKLKKSFDRILTNENSRKKAPSVKKEPVVVEKPIPIENMAPEEIHEKFQDLWKSNVQAGMDYLRSALFNDKVSLVTKEELLETLRDSDFPKEEFSFFTREILAQTENPYYFRRVLYMHGETISPERREFLITELLERTQNPEIKEIIMEFSVQEPVHINEY